MGPGASGPDSNPSSSFCGMLSMEFMKGAHCGLTMRAPGQPSVPVGPVGTVARRPPGYCLPYVCVCAYGLGGLWGGGIDADQRTIATVVRAEDMNLGTVNGRTGDSSPWGTVPVASKGSPPSFLTAPSRAAPSCPGRPPAWHPRPGLDCRGRPGVMSWPGSPCQPAQPSPGAQHARQKQPGPHVWDMGLFALPGDTVMAVPCPRKSASSPTSLARLLGF